MPLLLVSDCQCNCDVCNEIDSVMLADVPLY